MSIYTDKPTSNGVPLISANAFRIACDLQGARKRASLRELFSDYKQHEKRHFSTNGLGFNFMIDTTGSASIDKTQAVPDSPHGPQRDQNSVNTETPRIIDVLDEESDSDSEAEYEPSGASSASNPVRTPPRFSSLGNSDAATEFARTLVARMTVVSCFCFRMKVHRANPFRCHLIVSLRLEHQRSLCHSTKTLSVCRCKHRQELCFLHMITMVGILLQG